jgi:hypothetical protein
LRLIVYPALGLAAAVALAPGLAPGDETAPVDTQVKQPVAASAAVANADKEELRLPPGFKPRKRGKYVFYCRTETPLGTRFKSETCFDADQIRDYLIALQENKANVDRIRATCSSVCACGQPGSC